MHTDKKIRIRSLGTDVYCLTFPNGRSAKIAKVAADEWAVFDADGSACERAWNMDDAVRLAYAAAVDPLPPVRITADLLAEFAAEAERETTRCTKILRDLLKLRTGRAWSVKRCRGTAASWITITAPNARRASRSGRLAAEDFALLKAALGDAVRLDGVSLRPCGGARTALVYAAAGHPLPEGFSVKPPQWD